MLLRILQESHRSGRKTNFCGLLVTEHMQILRNNQPSPPLVKFVVHTLCPSVWPERTQMEAHSVLAAPHKCAEMLSSFTATERAEPSTVGSLLSTQWLPSSTSHGDQVCRLKSVFTSLYIDWQLFRTTCLLRVCVYMCMCSSRRPASQVCVLQLVLWIRPMTDTSYNPAISQHQGGTVPLPTRRRTHSVLQYLLEKRIPFSPCVLLCNMNVGRIWCWLYGFLLIHSKI